MLHNMWQNALHSPTSCGIVVAPVLIDVRFYPFEGLGLSCTGSSLSWPPVLLSIGGPSFSHKARADRLANPSVLSPAAGPRYSASLQHSSTWSLTMPTACMNA